MSIKNYALCALLFAAGSVDARGWRNSGMRGTAIRGQTQESGSFSQSAMRDRLTEMRERGAGGRGRGSDDKGRSNRGRKGKMMGLEALDRIVACEEEITVSCGMDFEFSLDELKTRLADRAAEMEAKKAEKEFERAQKHADMWKMCPALAEECGLPTVLPASADGEKPDRDAIAAVKDALRCIKDADETDTACGQYLDELEAEREAEKEEMAADRQAAKEKAREVMEQLKQVHYCLRNDVMPFLEEGSTCSEAFSKPEDDSVGAGSGEGEFAVELIETLKWG